MEGEQERRRYARVDVELFVRYKVLTPAEQQFEAKTKNIGGGGVCLVTREKLESGTIVAVEMKFPHEKGPIVAEGRVVWSRGSKMGLSPAGHERFDNGVEFIQIDEADRRRIVEHVNSEQKKVKTEGWKVGIVKDMHK